MACRKNRTSHNPARIRLVGQWLVWWRLDEGGLVSELVPTSVSAAAAGPAPGPIFEAPLVFVSYASRDVALAGELRGLLTGEGYRVWMAPDEIRGARPWAEQILEAIAAMSLMVVVVSSEAVGSAHVAREVNLALDRAKPVLPVRVEEVALSGSLQYLLALVQWIDAFPIPLTRHRDRLSKRIADLLIDGGHQPAAPEVSGDSPRPGTLGSGNLSVQPASFVGRAQELEEVAKLVRGSRLVTITGVGGAGKTRLALQAAGTMAAEFDDGVWLVDLAPLSEGDLVIQQVAAVFKVNEQVHRNLLESLVDHLRSRRCLVLLDNCEHLIDEASRVAAALHSRTERLRIMATSRESLHLSGEVVYQVPALGIPGKDQPVDPQTAARFDAVRLFVYRAESVRPGFRLTSETTAAIIEICRRLDGVPLAIELAAARLASFTPQQIASHLDQRFRLLSGGRRDGLPRQETLQATIDWSYALLNDRERLLFMRLAVFRGDFSLEAAQRIVAVEGLDEMDLLEVLPRLIDKSLIVAEPVHGEMRYRLLETLRQYAYDRWELTGERPLLETRHALRFLELAEEGAANVRSAKHEEVLDRLRIEHDNFRQALRWSLDNDEIETGLRLAGALYRFWLYNGNNSEGSWWLETLLARGRVVADSVRARAMLGFGSLSGQLIGKRRSAIAALEQAVEIYRSLAGDAGTRLDYATALNNLAADLVTTGEYAAAEARYEEALEIGREFDVQWGVALVLGNLGRLAALDGRLEQARARLDQSLDQARRLGSPQMLGQALAGKATFERDFGNLEDAVDMYQESIRVFLGAHHASGAQLTSVALAIAWIRLGDHDRALQEFLPSAGALLNEAETLNETEIVVELALGRAEIDLSLGASDGAAVLIGSVDRLAESGEIGDFLARLDQLKAEAEKRLDSGQLEVALARGHQMEPGDVHRLITQAADPPP